MIKMLQRSLNRCRKLLVQEAGSRTLVNSSHLQRTCFKPGLCSVRSTSAKLSARCSALHTSAPACGSNESGRGVDWDNFGIWNNRLEEPILLQRSINHVCLTSAKSVQSSALHTSAPACRSNESGRGVDWDNFGIWNNRLEEPILLQQSIKHGIPIPKISVQRIGHDSLTGRRPVNEDRICIRELRPNLLYVAIFDGHAGAMAVDFVHENLEDHLAFWLERERDLQVVLKNAFVDLNNKLTQYLYVHYPEPQHEHSGSTATVALLRNGNELVLANLGDSRAVLCRNGRAVRLTNDHDPDQNAKEKDRIKARGGYISWNSLGKPLVNGVLSMTRSFGDVTLKRYGVTAEPETRSLEIKHGRDSFLALFTDGVHFAMSDQELCDSVNLCHNPQEAARFIADQALQFGSEDNASVVVVPLGMWGRCNGPSLMHSLRWQGRSRA